MDHKTLKKEVAAVLQDVPNRTLPLFKFREMFERRYRRTISTSDLYRMRDVVSITDSLTGLGGRRISLSAEWSIKDDEGLDAFCHSHPPSTHSSFSSGRLGWAEKEIGVNLPNVEIDFRNLSARLNSVLTSHSGSFPLFSFLDCYGAQFGGMKRSEDGNGVPLEHLIGSVHGIEISVAENGMKRVQWKSKGEFEPAHPAGTFSGYDPLGIPLAQLSRELIDLLKTMPRCSVLFSKLIPAYHHHFGRQCRVADYGHITLSSLLQTLPNTIQVIGEGASRIITLAHKAQMKRFASDVFRVLKTQPGVKKQIRVADFPQAFSMTFPNKTFFPEDYGLCFFSDLISELVEHFTMVTLINDDKGEELLAIPKREQTPHELKKMQIFAAEVVELLGHSIRCEMQFSKFIPSYHHHFGRQCRVADYGFTKLAELFDAISDTVTCEFITPGIETNPEDKMLRLTPREQIKIVGCQIREVVEKQLEKGLPTKFDQLEDIFLSQHGFALRVDLCGASDLQDLLHRLVYRWVRVDGDIIRGLSEAEKRQRIAGEEVIGNCTGAAKNDCIKSFLEKEFGQLRLGNAPSSVDDLDTKVKLIREFGEQIRVLLEEAGGYLGIQNIDQAFIQKYGNPLNPSAFGCHSLMALLQSIPDVATLRGKFRTRRILVLNRVNTGSRLQPLSDNRNTNGGRGTYQGKCTGLFANRNQEPQGWKTMNGCIPAQAPLQTVAPPPLFSPMLPPSPVFSSRDTNIFNFEQPSALSSPIYDMWMGDNGAQRSPPPMSPSIVWAYHPFCYPPPGSPNLFIPSFSYGPWNSSVPTQPIMSPPSLETEEQPPAQ